MREEIAEMLRNAGFEVDEIISFEDTAGQLLRLSPDLILLDINLPQASGFQICREIKQKSAIPVLVLTSRDQMRDELHALELGADEYLTKPCRKERLLAKKAKWVENHDGLFRTANVLKRYEGRSHMLEGPGFLLDRQTYALYIHNRSVVLPGNQGRLLEAFLTHGGNPVKKEDLLTALWGTTEYIDENALQVNLTRLKKTMQELEMCLKIIPVRGVGYQLIPEGNKDE